MGIGVKRIDHVALVVRDLATTIERFREVLGAEYFFTKETKGAGYKVAYLMVGESSITAIEPTDPEGPHAAFLRDHGEGVHHIALDVEDLAQAVETLETKGIAVEGKKQGEVRKEALVPAGQLGGTMLELIEWAPRYQVPPATRWPLLQRS